MSHTQVILWISALLVLEINHFKWIWWTYWDCGGCRRKNKDCACGRSRKWLLLL